MQYITTTQLRTKSKELVKELENGNSVPLVHRSKVVGEIRPRIAAKPLTEADINEILRIGEKLNLPKLSHKEREKIYRKHLMKKYGKGLS